MITPKTALRVLHTADWHIGKRLYHQNRYEEFGAFLAWLHEMICQHEIDILIVAGDVFDTMTPSNHAQSLYYDFLAKMTNTTCQHIIIIGGNHDSPTLLDAPKQLLKSLNIHVVGVISDDIANDCLLLKDKDDNPQAIIMAVPYLRDKDIKVSTHLSDDDTPAFFGVAHHYQMLANHAKHLQQTIFTKTQKKLPIIATGHLFCAGANISSKDDGMREIHVGTLGQIPITIFDDCIDYVALGHIHAPQTVGGKSHIRYSGSPLALGFGEIGKQKEVLLIDFTDTLTIQPLFVPTFQTLCHIQGDLKHIIATLDTLINQQQNIWVQITYTGDTIEPQLNQKIKDHLENTQITPLNIQNKTLYQNSLHSPHYERLDNLNPNEVFIHRLAKEDLSDDEKQALTHTYQQALHLLYDTDIL